MKIFIVCSASNYSKIEHIEKILKEKGYTIIYPNGYKDLEFDKKIKKLEGKDLIKFKADLIRISEEKVKSTDILLVLNYDKEKNNTILKNYIGGATFLEVYNAFRLNKKIYFYNDIPDCIFRDELEAIMPIIINGDLNKII